MGDFQQGFTRRGWLKTLGAAGATLAAGQILGKPDAAAQEPSGQQPAPEFTGPRRKSVLDFAGTIRDVPSEGAPDSSDRPAGATGNSAPIFSFDLHAQRAFFVRWHLQTIPNAVDLKEWRLHVEGNVERPLTLSFPELTTRFKSVSVAAVNQCSGNSRSRLQPRVAGGQWGNGAMGNAAWTGVKLREILDAAGVKRGSVQVQFEGLDRGLGPKGFGSNRFMKSLDLTNPVIDECLVAYAMNGEPLPMLNGFPARLIVPGYFATYWLKSLSSIRVLDTPDDNFWMKAAYRIPDTPRGTTTPDEMKSGKVATVPIARMPVRSFLISPDGSSEDSRRFSAASAGHRFQRLWRHKKSGNLHRQWSELERRPLGTDCGRIFLPDLVARLDSQGRRTVSVGGSRDGREGKCPARRRGLESRAGTCGTRSNARKSWLETRADRSQACAHANGISWWL